MIVSVMKKMMMLMQCFCWKVVYCISSQSGKGCGLRLCITLCMVWCCPAWYGKVWYGWPSCITLCAVYCGLVCSGPVSHYNSPTDTRLSVYIWSSSSKHEDDANHEENNENKLEGNDWDGKKFRVASAWCKIVRLVAEYREGNRELQGGRQGSPSLWCSSQHKLDFAQHWMFLNCIFST